MLPTALCGVCLPPTEPTNFDARTDGSNFNSLTSTDAMADTDGLTAATYSNIWQARIIPGQQSERTLQVTRQEVAEKGDNARVMDESYSPREYGGKIGYCHSS